MTKRERLPGNRGTVQLGVIGAGEADEELSRLAREVGTLAAAKGWTLICGGLGGVMEAVSQGAAEGGGFVAGILPGEERAAGNRYLNFAVATGMGHGRNVLIPRSADVIIAVGGGFGTLSEIGLALKMGKTVVSLNSWVPHSSVKKAESPEEAVGMAEEALGRIDRNSERRNHGG